MPSTVHGAFRGPFGPLSPYGRAAAVSIASGALSATIILLMPASDTSIVILGAGKGTRLARISRKFCTARVGGRC